MITYQQAGVSIDAGNELVQRIKKIVSRNQSPSVIGGFSGLFPLPGKNQKLLLSGCCDGVGTKLKIAFLLNKHDTIGIDLVAMNVNDLICTGAKPLFFLDYYACGKLDVNAAEQVIRGIQDGCEQAGCVLLGGETAEMPGFYQKGEYDLAGFAVGLVEKKHVIDPKNVKAGDVVIGLASSGFHSNGYSLVRKVFSDAEILQVGKILLAPTRIYVKKILELLYDKPGKTKVKGIAHITGGGWTDNIPRVLPKGLQFRAKKGSWKIPEIFNALQKKARLPEAEMFRTFNMGIGLVLVVNPEGVSNAIKVLKEGQVLGKIERGSEGVVFE